MLVAEDVILAFG